jgi:hypothetical protein
MARCPGVHIGAGGEIDFGFEREALVEGRFDIGEPFTAAESLCPGNEGNLVFALGAGDERLQGVGGMRMRDAENS